MTGRRPAPVAVLLVGRARPSTVEVSDAVRALRDAGAEVTVVTHDPVSDVGAPVVVVGAAPHPGRKGGPLVLRMARLALQVLLRRTPSAALARATSGHERARAVLPSADVLVAGDSHAVEAVWRAARRLPGPAAVNGVPAAVRHLRGSGAA